MLTEVAEGVLVHQSPLIENNSIVVEGLAGVLVIDPGITGEELVSLANGIREQGRVVVAGFATHPDWDHALWHPDLGDAPRYGTAACAADLRTLLSSAEWVTQLAEVLPPEVADQVPMDLFGLIEGLQEGTQRLPWDGPVIRIIEHRAHAAGHAALVVEQSGVLVAGDMLSDVLVPMLDLAAADPIEDYLDALALFDDVANEIRVVIPGHGSVGGADDLRARIDLDREYLLALREGREPSDPRIGPSAKPGWDWVSGVHSWQQEQLQR